MKFTIESMLTKGSATSFFISLDDGLEYCPFLVIECVDPVRFRTYTEGEVLQFKALSDLLHYVVAETTKRRRNDLDQQAQPA